MSKRQRRRNQKQRRHAEAQRLMPSRRQLAAGAGMTLGATLSMGGVAHALCTVQVSNTNDMGAGSLRSAINCANTTPGSTITFASGVTGTINLGSNLPVITQATTIQGPGANQLTVSGQNAYLPLYLQPASGSPVTISGLTISGGKSVFGGGIVNNSAALTLQNSVVTGNKSTGGTGSNGYGGGIASTGPGSSLTLVSSTISGNTATGGSSGSQYAYGGGIFVYESTLTLINSTISGNTATGSGTYNGYGGGISAKKPGTVLIQNSTLSGNSSYSGGAFRINQEYGNVTIQNSTIASNHASLGGGILVPLNSLNGHNFTIQDSTIAGNSATADGGGIDDRNGSAGRVAFKDTIVAGNSSPAGPDLSSRNSSSFDSAFSLIQNTSGSTINQTVAGSGITGVDPQLKPLANNGGPTQTMALPLSSPAVDKGSAFGLTTDQRGVSRPFDLPSIANSSATGADGSDIGAFELQPSDLPSNSFSFGKKKLNKKKGTATIIVNVPGAGTISLSGGGVVTQSHPQTLSKQVSAAGPVALKVIPNHKTKKKLKRKHKAKVTVSVTFTPTGGLPNTQSEAVKLVKKH